MRSKEEAHDYRYFPEPDLVPFTIERETVETIKATLPELPRARRERFKREYSLNDYDAGVLVQSKVLAEFFECCVHEGVNAKLAANWLHSELLGYMNANSITWEKLSLTPKQLAGLIRLVESDTISGKIAKEILPIMITTGKSAETVVEEQGLAQVSDESALLASIDTVLNLPASKKSIDDFKHGKEQALGFLMGQVMKETKGKANPQMVNTLLRKRLT